jgi:hypothetical protein
MVTFAIIPVTCWLCALIATPRKPRFAGEEQELVYLRLLGRQQRLTLLALLATALALLGLLIVVSRQVGVSLPDDNARWEPAVGTAVPFPMQTCFPGDGRCFH